MDTNYVFRDGKWQPRKERTSFDTDLATLDDFHDRAYNGQDYDPIAMKEVWWRVSKAPEVRGHLGAYILLMYSMKYFPSTPDDEEATDETRTGS